MTIALEKSNTKFLVDILKKRTPNLTESVPQIAWDSITVPLGNSGKFSIKNRNSTFKS